MDKEKRQAVLSAYRDINKIDKEIERLSRLKMEMLLWVREFKNSKEVADDTEV